MRAKRAALFKEANTLHDLSVSESRDLTADEEVRYNTIMDDMDKLKVKIDRDERHESLKADLEQREGRQTDAEKRDNEKQGGNQKELEYRSAFANFLEKGIDGVTAEERSIVLENRALASGTGSAGGFTIPQGFYNDLIEAQKAFGGMRTVARILPTAGGNPLSIPTVNTTAQVGAILAESATAGSADPVFAQLSLGAYKYTSNIVLVPIELIQDSAFNLEAYLRVELARRIARITNTHFTVGTGAGQPTGVMTGAVLGKQGTTGQTTSVIYDDLIDLIHSVDPAYRGQSQFMFADSSLKAIKKLKDSQGRPLFLPGMAVNEPDTINGYRYTINQDVAAMAASAKSIAFGDFSNFVIRDVMDVQLVRFGEKFMDSGQIGFVAFSRHDSKLLNAGTNPVAYYQNSAT
jgi:HK97 family phage major capsid protein